MGRAWGRNLNNSDDCELAGWIDVREGAAEKAVEELGFAVEYTGTDLETAIKQVSPDFVVDVTPPEVHRHVTVTSLGHGIPVIGEKPMASTMREAKEMVAASDAAGKLYMVSQSRRYLSKQSGFKSLVDHEIGDLGILNVDFYIGAHFGGFRDEMASVLLIDMAIHTLDSARFISGLDPVSVFADEFNPKWSWYQGASSANAQFEMSNGARFNYRGSWCAEGGQTSWEGDWRAVGSKGTAIWHGSEAAHADVVIGTTGFHRETKRVEAPPFDIREGISGSLAEFLAALNGGPTPNGECHDNIKSLAMVFAAVESAKRDERVFVAEILD